MNQGERLKYFLRKKGISIKGLAEKVGVARSAIYGYFNTQKFQEDTLEELLSAMDMTREEFETDDIKVYEPPEKYHKSDPLLYKTRKPFYDVEIFATPGSELIEQVGKIEPDMYISVPHFADIDFYVRVSGDSMYPRYRHGDIIAVKKVDHKAFFSWYEPYVIITRTNCMRLLKYIHPDNDNEDSVLLVSYDKEKFPPQPLPVEEISALYLVKGKIEL